MHIVTINDFTDSEKRLLVFAWLCFDSDPKVDLHKLASLVGMTNTGSASNAWSKIRRKLRGELDVSSNSKSKKRAAGEMNESRAKKVKVAPAKARAPNKAKMESVDEEAEPEGDFLKGIAEYAE